MPSCYNILFEDNILLEDEEAASVIEEDHTEERLATGRITADVSWQAWLRLSR